MKALPFEMDFMKQNIYTVPGYTGLASQKVKFFLASHQDDLTQHFVSLGTFIGKSEMF